MMFDIDSSFSVFCNDGFFCQSEPDQNIDGVVIVEIHIKTDSGFSFFRIIQQL